MRLIDAKTLRIREFPSEDAYPAYAILSHTWDPAEQECTLQSMTEPNTSSRIGYAKIKHCCDQALKDGLSWAWVDTCCIDKTSTAELSEAINSMFRWYEKASICYAYIQDADTVEDLEKSRWFTRGWTLQELVAPHDVAFFSKSWDHLGRKLELKNLLWHITGIEPEVLESGTLSDVTVAKKMSWAAKRKTTRVEDLAYCLLGIFDVNMPMLYGEGQKSFIRLQEEIMKSSYDHTLFAWSPCPPTRTAMGFSAREAIFSTSEPKKLYGLLAESPSLFLHSNDIVPLENNFQSGNDVTSGSGCVVIQLPAFRKGTQLFAALSCITGSSYLALPLNTWHAKFVARRAEMVLVQADDLYTISGHLRMERFLVKPPTQAPFHAPPPRPNVSYIALIEFQNRSMYRMADVSCSPRATYDENAGILTLTRGHTGLHAACLLEPYPVFEQMQAVGGYLRKAAVLIGGDFTHDGKLWVAIVPVLPETDTERAFHEVCTQSPTHTTHCATVGMLNDQLAFGNQVSVFAKIGRQQVTCWVIGKNHGVTVSSSRTSHQNHYWKRSVYASAKIDVMYAHDTGKAFKITITCDEA